MIPNEQVEQDATQLLIHTINSTGGLVSFANGTYAPQREPQRIDLGEAYLSACAEQRVAPMVTPLKSVSRDSRSPARHTTYEPNATAWKPGDLVIHDDDAKRPDMLMVVLGCSKMGVYRTRYAFPKLQAKEDRQKVWRNTLEALHDPRRFGIMLKSDPRTPLNLTTVRKLLA
jgi:hypothetical protein